MLPRDNDLGVVLETAAVRTTIISSILEGMEQMRSLLASTQKVDEVVT
jgi:hypothetical protein